MEYSFFRTILGDKPPSEMGLTYSHEHIIIDDCYVTAEHPEFLLNEFKKYLKNFSLFTLLEDVQLLIPCLQTVVEMH